MKLHHLIPAGDGYGWGICSTNLKRELSRHFELQDSASYRIRFDAPIFIAIPDSTLALPRPYVAPAVYGLCFTEAPLSDDAVKNAADYRWIFTGSDWNTERLRAAGIANCSTMVQGVDFKRFSPQPWPEVKGFRVFSGGKYEYRKGQDYVITAMKHFMAIRKDAFLITSWYNPWDGSAATMCKSWMIDPANPLEGLPRERVISLPPTSNSEMPAIYAQTHVGLFPNRCEAGTNLVMMEYMACGRPVIATDATGHADVLHGDGPLLLSGGDYDPAGWFNPNVSDIIAHLEHIYAQRSEIKLRGQQCAELIKPWSWTRAGETVAKQIRSLG